MASVSQDAAGRDPAFRPQEPVVIGLAGGVASGKSTVAGLFAARGLRHIDADRLAREVAGQAEVLAAVATELGGQYVRDGALDRPALAQLVFADQDAKARLERILHPPVRQRIRDELDAARAAGDSALLDVPLLFENGLSELCDTVVFVATAEATRAARARARGWADGELARREANQLPLADKRARSQHVVDNDGDLQLTRRAVDDVLSRLAGPNP